MPPWNMPLFSPLGTIKQTSCDLFHLVFLDVSFDTKINDGGVCPDPPDTLNEGEEEHSSSARA